jgi:hypothetical protein
MYDAGGQSQLLLIGGLTNRSMIVLSVRAAIQYVASSHIGAGDSVMAQAYEIVGDILDVVIVGAGGAGLRALNGSLLLQSRYVPTACRWAAPGREQVGGLEREGRWSRH